jgi:hypothetical protein
MLFPFNDVSIQQVFMINRSFLIHFFILHEPLLPFPEIILPAVS